MQNNIPEYPNYHITNNGRLFNIKTGKEKKPTLNKETGYLMVTLYSNNVGTTKYIHRLVAEAYIPNPDYKPQVNHINHCKTCNEHTNLEWVTAKENTVASIRYNKQKHFLKRNLTSEEYLNIAKEVINGKSLTEAVKQYNIGLSSASYHVREAAENNNLGLAYHNAIIQNEYSRKINQSKEGTHVAQYTKSGLFIAEYSSIQQAGKATNTRSGSIVNVLKGRAKTANGFIWKHL